LMFLKLSSPCLMFGMAESQSTFRDDERRSDAAGFEARLRPTKRQPAQAVGVSRGAV
jgi:hypothetical protein